ncbi:hypothetical protein [Paenibacillus spongiae]|nr:hypothetical protein [Paenibacillus spongiae]
MSVRCIAREIRMRVERGAEVMKQTIEAKRDADSGHETAMVSDFA